MTPTQKPAEPTPVSAADAVGAGAGEAAGDVVVQTWVAAAQLLGVTPATVRAWVRRGELEPGPWTEAQLREAAARPRSRAGRPRGVLLADHGTETRYSAGCRCVPCTTAHSTASKEDRRVVRDLWWQPRRDRLLRLVGAGASLPDACRAVDATIQALSAHRREHPDFAAALDDALVAGRDPALDHGSHGAWREGCRCPDCRTTHDASRLPRR